MRATAITYSARASAWVAPDGAFAAAACLANLSAALFPWKSRDAAAEAPKANVVCALILSTAPNGLKPPGAI